MRIDSHQHFWRYNSTDYVWMSDAMDSLRRDYLPADLAPLLQALDFDGSIAVQARQMLVETEWLLDLADAHSSILGVVGWVDFTSNRLDEELERLAARPKLRGVRELIHDMPDPNYAVSERAHPRRFAATAVRIDIRPFAPARPSPPGLGTGPKVSRPTVCCGSSGQAQNCSRRTLTLAGRNHRSCPV